MKYEIQVPYSELVYGVATYILEADSIEEAKEIMDSPQYYEHFHDCEQLGETNYDENFFDMTIEELNDDR